MTSASDDARWMRLALREAEAARDADEVPIGAVIVAPAGAADDDAAAAEVEPRVVGRAHNHTRRRGDPTAHAELLAIQSAVRELGYQRLLGCTVYSTVEPCFMCAGALSQARVARVVWAIRDPKFGGCASLGNVLSDERLNHRAEIAEGVLADEARALMQEFFRSLRRRTSAGD